MPSRRAAILAGLERKLAQGDKALVSNKGFRRFVKTDRVRQLLRSTTTGSRRTRSSTACSCCAPTPNCRRSRSCCAIATCWPWRMPSRPPRRCSPRGRSSTRPTPPSAVTCSAASSPLLLRKELFDRLAARRHGNLEWQHIVDDLDELSEIEVEQDGRRARAANRSRPDHRSALPRPRHCPAARLPGDSARARTRVTCGA